MRWFFVFRLNPLLPALGVEGGEGGQRDDALYVVARLQDLNRRARPQQHRANRLGLGQARNQLIGDVGAGEAGEHQDVGVLHPAERETLVDEALDHGGIGLHLAIDRQVGAQAVDQRRRVAHFVRQRVFDAAKVAE